MLQKKNSTPITPVKSSPAIITPHREYSSRSYFCSRSSPELEAIDDLVRYIRGEMTGTYDQEWGTVYAVQARGTEMTKVGYTSRAEVVRVEEHMKACGIQFQRMYQHPGFQGAHKAEQIILKLMKQYNFEMHNCACGVGRHIEWVSKPFLNTVTTVQLVCNWMQYQTPYHPGGKLQKEWQESLNQWYGTQRTTAPLEWEVFFLRHTLYWRDYPIHLPYRQRVSQELVYSPKAPSSKTPSSERHRPTGYFELTPIECHEHEETHQQRREVETVKYPSGRMVSKIKEEQNSHALDTHPFSDAAFNTGDGNVFNAKTPSRRDTVSPEVEQGSKPSEYKNDGAIYPERKDFNPERSLNSNGHNSNGRAHGPPPSKYGLSRIPKLKIKPKGRENEYGNGKGDKEGGSGSGSGRNHRTPQPQSDGKTASDNGDANFTTSKLSKRTTMTGEVKAGASKMIDVAKTAVRKTGISIKNLPNGKSKKN